MSRLSPVPAAELATKDDVRAVRADIGRVEGKAARLVESCEADLQQRAAEREADLQQREIDRKERAAERKAGLQQRAAEREADLKAHAAERKAAGRREWMFAHALAVEVAVVLAAAVAILEWLRS